MQTKDVQEFYDRSVAQAEVSYEERRWFSSSQARAGHEMTKTSIQRYAVPLLGQGMRVAELGPGPGTWTKEILASGSDVAIDLIDISREMLGQAGAALPNGAKLRFFETDFLNYSPTTTYDFFFSSRALEYFPDKDALAKKIGEVLKPGGTGFLITKYPHYTRLELQGKQVTELHRSQIGPDALQQVFEEHGLSIGMVRGCTFVFPKVHLAWLDKMLFAIFSRPPLNPLSTVFVESYCVTFVKQ